MQSQPWRSQRVEHERQHQSDGLSRREGSSSSVYATPPKSAKFESTLKPSTSQLPIELLSSPSRGLDQSDVSRDITNAETQSQYRLHISERIKKHSEKYGPLNKGKQRELFPIELPDTIGHSNQRAAGIEGAILESLQDIMLLVRTLREGCVAAARRDAFAVDVYALSTFISVLIAEDIQLSSSLPKLFDLLASQAECKEPVYAVQRDLELLLGGSASTHIDLRCGSIAALYLLWLSVTGGHVARVGGTRNYHSMASGQWLQHKDFVMTALDEDERSCASIMTTEALQGALSRHDVIAFREILLKTELDIWQQAMIRRSIDRLRDETWNTLTKSYMQVPIDGRLLGEGEKGDNWLERMLLIDTEVMSIPAKAAEQRKHPSNSTAIPDTWDDSVDQLADALKTTAIEDVQVLAIRARRLATVFERYSLSINASPSIANGSPLDKWKSRKVMQAGLPHLKLR